MINVIILMYRKWKEFYIKLRNIVKFISIINFKTINERWAVYEKGRNIDAYLKFAI